MESIESANRILSGELNIEEMFNQARKQQAEKKFYSATNTLELICLNKLDFKDSILYLAIKSFIDNKTSNINSLRRLAHKLLFDFNKEMNSHEIMEQESENQYMKILYRAGCEEETIKLQSNEIAEINYLGCFLFWKCYLFQKRIEPLESRKLFTEEIEKKYFKSLDEVSLQVSILFS